MARKLSRRGFVRKSREFKKSPNACRPSKLVAASPKSLCSSPGAAGAQLETGRDSQAEFGFNPSTPDHKCPPRTPKNESHLHLPLFATEPWTLNPVSLDPDQAGDIVSRSIVCCRGGNNVGASRTRTMVSKKSRNSLRVEVYDRGNGCP